MNKIFDLTGKRALIIGASKGIGLAAADILYAFGASLTLIARGEMGLKSAANRILKSHEKTDEANRPLSREIEIDAMDICDTAKLEELVETKPVFDIVVNSAGMNIPLPTLEVNEEIFDSMLSLNLKAGFFLSKFVARKMIKAKKQGSIIHLSSQMGHVGGENRSVYCATKHAMEGFVKAMAWEWGTDGIRINTICPTFVLTPMTKGMLDDASFKERVISQIALNKIAMPEDIQGAILYLASDASKMVTGSSLKVDGGWTAK